MGGKERREGRWDGGGGKEGGEERVINHKTLSPHNLHVQTNPQVIIPTCVCVFVQHAGSMQVCGGS